MRFELPTERSGLLSPEWLAESVRVTSFGEVPVTLSPLWTRIVGRQPTEVHERPAEGIRVEMGDFEAGVLVLQQQNGRTDFVYGAKNDPALMLANVTSGELLHVGPVLAAISALLNLLSGVEDIFDDALRLAFSPIILRPGVDEAEVNEFISAYTRLPIGPTETDILWSVNKSLPAMTLAGRINRVVKWQSASVSSFPFFWSLPKFCTHCINASEQICPV